MEAVRIIDGQLRYYLHIDPDPLTDDEWAMQVKTLEYIRKQEAGETGKTKK
ncbi:hypothetical protein LJB95_03240 [Paludibacteraceae bacterium OttesenSCG-928-F17]|nr:hypothetical protein [Paludibacteraceae bacterium OttesenSCG-928-F17]